MSRPCLPLFVMLPLSLSSAFALQAAAAKEATALEAEAEFFASLEGKGDWPMGEGTGCKVLENVGLQDLRQQILQPPESPEAEPTEAEPGAEETEATETEPRFADGTEALDTLAFDNDWFEDNLTSLRSAIFENLTGQKRYLDRVDIPAACEEVRRDLDQRLRRHTNRKGEVQVGWEMQRNSEHVFQAVRIGSFSSQLAGGVVRSTLQHRVQAQGTWVPCLTLHIRSTSRTMNQANRPYKQ